MSNDSATSGHLLYIWWVHGVRFRPEELHRGFPDEVSITSPVSFRYPPSLTSTLVKRGTTRRSARLQAHARYIDSEWETVDVHADIVNPTHKKKAA